MNKYQYFRQTEHLTLELENTDKIKSELSLQVVQQENSYKVILLYIELVQNIISRNLEKRSIRIDKV